MESAQEYTRKINELTLTEVVAITNFEGRKWNT